MDDHSKFIKKWQKIEDAVISRARMTDNQGFVKAFDCLTKEDALLSQKAGLVDDLRALRNVYSHRDRAKYIAKLEDHVLSDLEEIYELVTNPPTVMDKFACDVYTANPDELILTVMDAMTENVYTNVPVIEKNLLVGVFSYNSFFEWAHDVLRQTNMKMFEKTHVSDIDRKYLLPPSVYYNTVRKDLPAGNVEAIFRDSTTNVKRLDCLLITEDGSKSKPILGIITPWDLHKIH